MHAETASYILEAGDYLVRVGVSSAETAPAAVLHLDKTVTTLQAKNVLGCTDFTDLAAPAATMDCPGGVPLFRYPYPALHQVKSLIPVGT